MVRGLQYLSLALVAVLLIGLLASCGGQTDEVENSQTEAISYDPNSFDPVGTDSEGFGDNCEGSEHTEDNGKTTEDTEDSEDSGDTKDDGEVDLPPIPI